MKVTIEKVPEGVKVTFAGGSGKAPASFIVRPGEVTLLTTMLQTAMNATSFKFEFQT